jgi:hypothetical protein
MDFAVPVTAMLPRKIEPAQLQNALEFAVAVWNAAVLEGWGTHPGLLMRTRAELLSKIPPQPELEAHLWRWRLDKLIKRRQKRKFRGDLRAVGDLQVYRDPEGNVRIRAEAKLSEDLRRYYGLT